MQYSETSRMNNTRGSVVLNYGHGASENVPMKVTISQGSVSSPGSRCTSGKSTKTSKSVRFNLPGSPEGPQNSTLNGDSSVCDAFFGIQDEDISGGGGGKGNQSSQCRNSGWRITSDLSNLYSCHNSVPAMRPRGPMSATRKVPGRYFPMPSKSSKEEKKNTVPEGLQHKPRIKSAPTSSSMHSINGILKKKLPQNTAPSLESYGLGTSTPRHRSTSALLKRDTNQQNTTSYLSFWEKYETKSDTFGITFRDSDTANYDPVNIGKPTTPFPTRSFSNGFPHNGVRTVPKMGNLRQSVGFFGCLEGKSKTLHNRTQVSNI